MSQIWLIIVLGGVLTYATRIAGHLLLTRLETIPPRLEAALNAVPPAMLVTLVAPTFVDSGWLERAVIVASGLLALRLSVLGTVVVAIAAVAAFRAAGL